MRAVTRTMRPLLEAALRRRERAAYRPTLCSESEEPLLQRLSSALAHLQLLLMSCIPVNNLSSLVIAPLNNLSALVIASVNNLSALVIASVNNLSALVIAPSGSVFPEQLPMPTHLPFLARTRHRFLRALFLLAAGCWIRLRRVKLSTDWRHADSSWDFTPLPLTAVVDECLTKLLLRVQDVTKL
eukprot:1093616-Pleurochrysis_carterae.AAC.3